MVDVTEDFLVKAKTYLGEEGKRVRNYFCCGLQDFSPEPSSYDVIWIQWVIGARSAPSPPPCAVPLRSRAAHAGLGAGRLQQAGRGASSAPPGLPGRAETLPRKDVSFFPLFQLNTCCSPFRGSFLLKKFN